MCHNYDVICVLRNRYVAIVHPIRASVWCRRKVILTTIGLTWLVAGLCGLPTAIFNQVSGPTPDRPVSLCTTTFPAPHRAHYTAYKTAECLVFFILPVVLQVSLLLLLCYVMCHTACNLSRLLSGYSV